jgi:hypothetical protein
MTQLPPATSKRKRPPPSRHGLLFGGDALYQVLEYLANERPREFTTKALAKRIKRTPEHTRAEIDKLIAVGVVGEVRRDRKTRIYGIRKTDLSKEMLDLPAVLVEQLGRYRRPRA